MPRGRRHLDAYAVLAVIIETQGLGAALALVVAGAPAVRVDVGPIILGLRVDGRVAVDLARGRLQELSAQPLGQPQHVDGAEHAGLGRLHRIELVVHGRGGAREIVDLVDLDIEGEGYVVTQQLEVRVFE